MGEVKTDELSIDEFYEQEISRLIVELMNLWRGYQEHLKSREGEGK